MQTDLELRLCRDFGFNYCILFPRARDAIRAWVSVVNPTLSYIPSNVCPELQRVMPGYLLPVSPLTGMVPSNPVQLYGYREISEGAPLEIDPLMTGRMGAPFAKSTVISFGKSKTVDAGGGGAFLTNDRWLARKMQRRGYLPPALPIWEKLDWFNFNFDERRRRLDLWDRHLGDSCVRIPREQIMPWRVIRRIPEKRDLVVTALRSAGVDAGTNYPPLPGVTDPGAIQWGREVINFSLADDYDESRIKSACRIIKRTLAQ